MKLTLNQPISIGLFHKTSFKTFVTEASDLGDTNMFQRIYDDACDVGFRVVNPATGNEILLVFTDTIVSNPDTPDYSADGWTFTPSYEDVRKHPRLEGYKFLVFND
jgi:hypothetical protein